MAVRADTILNQAATDLNDATHQYWPEDELLAYLNDGQQAAVILKPEVSPEVADFTLTAGAVQNFGSMADGYILLDVNCFKSTASEYEGIITPVERKDMDNIDPGWRKPTTGQPPSDLSGNYVYDVRNRHTFYLYPSYTDWNNWLVEIVYAKSPAPIASTTSNITIDDIYAPALLAYVMHRARAKDITVEGQSVQLSTAFYNKFVQLITGETNQEREIIIRADQTE